MGIRIDGKAIAAAVRADVKSEVQALKEQGIFPGMAVVIVGDDPASRIYVNNKKKACEAVGIKSVSHVLSGETTEEELLQLIDELNADQIQEGINGFVFRNAQELAEKMRHVQGMTLEDRLALHQSVMNSVSGASAKNLAGYLLDIYSKAIESYHKE